MRRRVIIHWGISSFFGWGVYGLNLALQWSADPDVAPVCSLAVAEDQIRVDLLRRLKLQPFLEASAAFARRLAESRGSRVSLDTPLLAGVDGAFALGRAAHEVMLTGRPTVATTFFETGRLGPDAVARAGAFDLVIAGSAWNAEVLKAHGVARVATVLQGVDPTLFHPAPRSGLFGDRFLVFSGGKLERRKGQDIVIAAFRRFAERRPEALLVTAWHSPWPKEAASLDRSGLAAPVPFTPGGQVDVLGWAAANGLAPGQVLDVGATPNALMPTLLREMDVAVFPNRCEGGTNLVAMEAMACGVPTILAANTGQLDLIRGETCFALTAQGAVLDQPGWGESDVDEVVAALEQAYGDREAARRRGAAGGALLSDLTWARTATGVKAALLSVA